MQPLCIPDGVWSYLSQQVIKIREVRLSPIGQYSSLPACLLVEGLISSTGVSKLLRTTSI